MHMINSNNFTQGRHSSFIMVEELYAIKRKKTSAMKQDPQSEHSLLGSG
jgi:hypothetical protein